MSHRLLRSRSGQQQLPPAPSQDSSAHLPAQPSSWRESLHILTSGFDAPLEQQYLQWTRQRYGGLVVTHSIISTGWLIACAVRSGDLSILRADLPVYLLFAIPYMASVLVEMRQSYR
jgi:hypothetical protein